MLPSFKAGLGGRIGSGKQKLSWVALDDLVEMFLRTIEDRYWTGVLNAVSPSPVENQTFTETIGSVLNRPLAIKLLFGEMGRETVLSDLAVQPERLKSLAYGWRFPELEAALHHTLGKPLPKKRTDLSLEIMVLWFCRKRIQVFSLRSQLVQAARLSVVFMVVVK